MIVGNPSLGRKSKALAFRYINKVQRFLSALVSIVLCIKFAPLRRVLQISLFFFLASYFPPSCQQWTHKTITFYVSAIYSSIPGNRSASSSATSPTFSIKLQAVTSYVSDVNVNTPMKPNLLESLAKSSDAISGVISEANIGFSLDRIQWKGNPREEDWTRLQSQDDLLRRILDLITHSHDDDEFTLILMIDKKTILAHHVHERMYYARSVQRAARDATRMVSFMNQQEASLGRPFLSQHMAEHCSSAIEREGTQNKKAAKLIPATQSSIQSLEEVIFDGTEPATLCTICLETMEIGSPVTLHAMLPQAQVPQSLHRSLA
ncbi:hypothetical protein OIU74_028510 [Salix koriyanagi]|uniref:Uncharacterized protein n=1 Tax=Salix koriyanagi TaxID=2511006 RepID=A0A9Q0ZT34_9ROSI|nr:hypothetical protein OIU74_028510 [Salix koriyanagi]